MNNDISYSTIFHQGRSTFARCNVSLTLARSLGQLFFVCCHEKAFAVHAFFFSRYGCVDSKPYSVRFSA